jgi:phosphoribosylaminoimidazole-succinocarboxamide synthase
MGLVAADVYNQMKTKALELFALGTEYLEERGIVLVDTKYEFGLLDGQLILIDEIHTPDSSRFWRAADFAQNPDSVEQMDKEFVRQWLLANQVNNDIVDVLPDDVVQETSRRYLEIYRLITNKDLVVEQGDVAARIAGNLSKEGVI